MSRFLSPLFCGALIENESKIQNPALAHATESGERFCKRDLDEKFRDWRFREEIQEERFRK
jgi:hypothetical protein